MKHLKSIITLTAAAVLASGLPAAAQGIKIGTVDMNKIFSSYYKTKDAESRINEARAAAKKELDDRMDTHKKTIDEIKKIEDDMNNPALSKTAKDEKAKSHDEKVVEFRNLERDINEFRTTREKQLQEQAVRMRNGIVEEISKLVKDKVNTEGYNIVLDRSGNSLNGVPIVVFANDNLDFSDDIIKALNKSKPADTADTSASATPAAKPAKKK
jgi:outer membrane protein